MSNLLPLFANNLLPIFLTAGAGYLAGRWLNVDARSISRLVFYVFSPCLIFDLLATSQLSNGDMLQMIAFTISCILIVGVLTYAAGRLLKLPRKTMAAVLLATMTLNAGNYGLSLNLFAFGEQGLAYASLFFVTSAIVTYTLGVAIASMGSASLVDSLKGLVKIPTVYAVILAVFFVALNWQLPLPLQRTVSLLSDASIPGMLIILGLQLQKNGPVKNLRALALANGMRLIGGPLIALGLVLVFGLQGTARQVGITQAAMPTAVLSIVLATEYDTEPVFVTTAVFVSTLLSPIILTPLLAYLGA
ncbi:MAG: AEC family transporter [Anaerolineales bacterium]|nr:AEC family transporter [Anaerolineales bacterium]